MSTNKKGCCPCCTEKVTIEGPDQGLTLNSETGDLTLFPNGTILNLCNTVRNCETDTQVSVFRLIGGSMLELVYIGEDKIPVSKTVDLGDLDITVTPITVLDTNTIDLNLAGTVLSGEIKIDPASTAIVSSSAAGLRIDSGTAIPLIATDSNTLDLTASGTEGHSLTGSVRYQDSPTIDISDNASGLIAAVKISSDPDNLITVDGTGLNVDSATILGIVEANDTFSATTPLSYNPGTKNLTIAQAGAGQNGFLLATDWTLFNGKVSPTRNIFTQSPLAGGGDLSTDRTISIPAATTAVSGHLTATDWNNFNGKVSPTRLINTTAPLTGGGDLSANRTLGITQASTSVSGFLHSADFTNFNARVNTASNVGSGVGLFKQKSSVDLQFRTLLGTPGQIVVTQGIDTVTIAIDPAFAPGGGGGAAMASQEEGVTLTASTTTLNFVGTGVTASNVGTVVSVNVPSNSDWQNSTYGAGINNAVAADLNKVIFLDATAGDVTYNINPATFTNKMFVIYTLRPGINTVTIVPLGGTIEGYPDYQPSDREAIHIYSNGTNLFFIAKN